jgi:hypothetical protein
MSFTLTVHNVSDAQLGPLIARMALPKTTKLEVAHDSTEGPPVARAVASTTLRMTGRTPRRSTLLATALTLFEKLEVAQGIGNVTRQAFREELHKKKTGKDVYTRLLNEGYIEHRS